MMNRSNQYIFTSESVTEGHPDKVCDFIADSILDAQLAEDRHSRVACEVLCKASHVVVAGEISSHASVNYEHIAREAIRHIGYLDASEAFNADSVEVLQFISAQAPEIARGVGGLQNPACEQGAGDQGMMFGYATIETPELMPLPILLAHRLARGLAEDRRSGRHKWLRPDGKTQVSVLYENDEPRQVTEVVVSTQHRPEVDKEVICDYVTRELAPHVLGKWNHREIKITVNPTGSFVQGGPSADCGVTGRKIIVDTYGGMGRHGGGAFSGKDPSKVDRSAAYFCRYAARQLVSSGLALRAEVQVAYAIGVAQPVSLKVDAFGTGDQRMCEAFLKDFDFRPRAIIERLDLLRPIYRETTNYGHFGKNNMPWDE